MSVTETTPVYDYDTDKFMGAVLVYVAATGRVWANNDNYNVTAPGEFSIIDPSGPTKTGDTTGEPSWYGGVVRAWYNAYDQHVYAIHAWNRLSRYNSSGAYQYRVTHYHEILAFDPSGGAIYGMNANGGGYNAQGVYAITASTGAVGSLLFTLPGTEFFNGYDPIVDNDGHLWFTIFDGTKRKLYKLNTSSWTTTAIIEGTSTVSPNDRPRALVFLPATNQVAVRMANGDLAVFNSDGTQASRNSMSPVSISDPSSATGEVRWMWNSVRSCVSVSDASPANSLTDVTPSTAAEIRTEALSYRNDESIAVNTSNGDVYFTGWTGNVAPYNAQWPGGIWTFGIWSAATRRRPLYLLID